MIDEDTRDVRIAAPNLDYQPRDPRATVPPIALIGCGGITRHHLTAYRNAGYPVVALCDVDEARAKERQQEFFPDATVYTDASEVLRRDDIAVIDVATHPAERASLIEAALLAGKHVLSQKPFVLDLDTGERLVELADRQGVKLAVNQNARWAPHFSYLRQAVQTGLLGDLLTADLSVHWDHSWVVGTPFDNIRDLVLYDFAIHWFDIVTCFFNGVMPKQVYAAVTPAVGQPAKPPLLAHVVAEYETAQASLLFNAFTRNGSQDRTLLVGTNATALSDGPSLFKQTVTLFTPQGQGSPTLEGAWFPDGFHGTMAALLCAIEEDREPEHSGRNNLASLAFAFAAIASSHTGAPQVPGQIRTL